MQQMIFIADLIACSTCFGHHYAHHQELESIIQVVAACRIWCLVFKLSVWCGAEGYVSGLRAAARKPDTQPCNKNHLLHLVGILFPHMKFLYSYHSQNSVSVSGDKSGPIPSPPKFNSHVIMLQKNSAYPLLEKLK